MTSLEFAEWRAYRSVYGLPLERLEVGLAVLCALTYNATKDKRAPSMKPHEWLGRRLLHMLVQDERSTERGSPVQSKEEIRNEIAAGIKAMTGIDLEAAEAEARERDDDR